MHRSMDNLENLSDAELRHRLIQYGFPNMPITGTTRKILIKKLRNHINNERDKLKNETNYARYSSDDEVDMNSIKNKGKKVFHSPQTRKTISSTKTSPLTSINSPVLSSQQSPILNNFKRPGISYQSDQFYNTSRVHVPPPIFSTENEFTNKIYPPLMNNTILSSSSKNCTTDNFTDDPIANNDDEHNQHKINGTNNSPYVSDFTRRLLNLRDETLKDSLLYRKKDNRRSQYIPSYFERNRNSAHKIPLSNSRNDNKYSQSPSAAFSNLLIKLNEQFPIKQTLISYMLVGMFVIFLSLLAIIYLTITPDIANTLSPNNVNYIDCEKSQALMIYNEQNNEKNCIQIESLDNALELIKSIIPVLQERIENHFCVDSAIPVTLSNDDIIRTVQNKRLIMDVRKTIVDAEHLIKMNPQWKISQVNEKGELINNNNEVMDKQYHENFLTILNPRLPFLCSLYNKLQKFFFIVGAIGVIVLIIGILYFCYKFIIYYKKSKREIINNFTEEIVNHLMTKASKDPDQSAVVLNHLRDKIIPLHKRQKMELAWQEAVNYLENNESRLQFIMNTINGEDCLTVKWVDTVNTEVNPQLCTIKKWQSPAFDKTNKIINPPTSCLKIRQMFDKFEASNPNLKTIIQDAILEKVGPTCKIYDIQLDTQSCCVYVRCATEEDAGIVHNEINGWWFDKRLVSIKFLRIERYLNRFAKSSAGPACLYPSNAKNLSMSQCSNNVGRTNMFYNDNDDDTEN